MLFHAKLADEFISDLQELQFHTSMLDSTVMREYRPPWTAYTSPLHSKEHKAVPSSSSRKFASYTIGKNRDDGNKETYTYDILLMDREGTVLVEINDYTVKKVHKFNNYEDKPYYMVNWVPLDEGSSEEEGIESLGNVLYSEARRRWEMIFSIKSKEKSEELILVERDDFSESESFYRNLIKKIETRESTRSSMGRRTEAATLPFRSRIRKRNSKGDSTACFI